VPAAAALDPVVRRLAVTGGAAALRSAAEQVAALAVVAGGSPGRRDDLVLAVHELLANALEHGHRGDGTIPIVVEVVPGAGGGAMVRVADTAVDGPWDAARTHATAAAPADAERGRGLSIVTALTDELTVDVRVDATVVAIRVAGEPTRRHPPDPAAGGGTVDRAVDLHEVRFGSDGLVLAGDLRVPAGDGPYPALTFTGPLTGVKGQVVGRYAAALATAGFVTLAFDHRTFGASDGTPRQDETVGGKLADLRDAVSFLATRPEVDPARIGCVGICLGGGYAVRAGAADPRIGAVATVAGCFNDPRAFRDGMGADGYRRTLRRFADQLTADARADAPAELPAVAPDDGEAAMPGREPWAYYGTERSAAPGWENRLTVRSIRELLTFDAAGAADLLAPTPLLVVHGRRDDYCSPDGARGLVERHGAAELVWLDAEEHIDLYDVERFVAPAVAHLSAWFQQVLAG
jgi:uncharacterized protein